MLPAGLKVALVLNDLRVGGSERQALLLAEHLSGFGAEPVVIGLSNPGELLEECRSRGVRTLVGGLRCELSALHLPLNCIRALRLLRMISPDVIVGYTGVPNLYGGLLWRLTAARLFVWSQRDDGLYRPPAVAERWAVRNTPLFIANSRSGSGFLRRELKVPAELIHTVPNGVEIPSRPPERGYRRSLGIGEEDFVACMVGNLRPPKDHRTLIEAWSIVVGRRPSPERRAVLLLLGRKQEGGDLLAGEVARLGLEGDVRFLGHLPDVQPLLAEADLGVFSSASEGLPNGLLDCMAAGLPVVATDLAGTRECLDASQQEYLAPPGDAQGFAAKVLALMARSRERERLGRRNRERAAVVYSPARMAERTLAVLALGLETAARRGRGERTW